MLIATPGLWEHFWRPWHAGPSPQNPPCTSAAPPLQWCLRSPGTSFTLKFIWSLRVHLACCPFPCVPFPAHSSLRNYRPVSPSLCISFSRDECQRLFHSHISMTLNPASPWGRRWCSLPTNFLYLSFSLLWIRKQSITYRPPSSIFLRLIFELNSKIILLVCDVN